LVCGDNVEVSMADCSDRPATVVDPGASAACAGSATPRAQDAAIAMLAARERVFFTEDSFRGCPVGHPQASPSL